MSTYPIEELDVDTVYITYENNKLRFSPVPSFLDKDVIETPVTELIVENPKLRIISENEFVLEKRKHDSFYEPDASPVTHIRDLFRI